MKTLLAILLALLLASGFTYLTAPGANAVTTPAAVAEVLTGPSCTPVYPRGFKVAKGTKKKPLKLCYGGDLQNSWGTCHERFRS